MLDRITQLNDLGTRIIKVWLQISAKSENGIWKTRQAASATLFIASTLTPVFINIKLDSFYFTSEHLA